MQTITLSQSHERVLYKIFYRCSNRKGFLIFTLLVIIVYSIYFFVSMSSFNSCRLNSSSCNWIEETKNKIKSPFQNTLGFVRWNSAHYERIAIIDKYRPFFANLHYSIPNYTLQLNYTADGWKPFDNPYKPVSDTMKIILQNYSTIEGLLYFHFDVSIVNSDCGWVDVIHTHISYSDTLSIYPQTQTHILLTSVRKIYESYAKYLTMLVGT
jgi:hypothetical protein